MAGYPAEYIIRHRVKKNRKWIINMVDGRELLQELANVVPQEQIHHIRDKDNRREATHELIDILEKSQRPGRWTFFLQALEKNNYPYMASVLKSGEKIDNSTMEDQRNCINCNCTEIEQRIDPVDIARFILQFGTLTQSDLEQVEQVMETKGRTHASRKLLSLMPNREKDWYEHFLWALGETKYDDLCDKIRKSKKKICERQYDDSRCCSHPEKPVVSHSKERKKLVCLGCITSSDHSGHSFSDLECICKERENIIGNFFENNNRIFQPNVSKSITEIKEQENFNKENDAIKTLPIIPPKHKQTIVTSTSFDNKSSKYYALTPVTEDKSWCGIMKYNEDDKKYYITNKLCMINKQGSVEQELQTSANISRLCLHPITGVLYGTFDDNTICTIDTTTGATTTVLTCPYRPESLTVTPDGDIIVGEWSWPGHVYRYSSNGQLLHQSKEKYIVFDISYSDINDHVAIACDRDGVTIMDGTLTNVIHKHKLRCRTAVYDRDGSLLIGDRNNKSIHILDGQTFSTIRTFTPPQMSRPEYIRLYDNSMWVECWYPRKIVHVMFQ